MTLLSTNLMQVYSLAYSPKGKWLASGSSDMVLRIWNADTGQRSQELSGHNGTIPALAFDPEGKFLASGDATGVLVGKIWKPTAIGPPRARRNCPRWASVLVFTDTSSDCRRPCSTAALPSGISMENCSGPSPGTTARSTRWRFIPMAGWPARCSEGVCRLFNFETAQRTWSSPPAAHSSPSAPMARRWPPAAPPARRCGHLERLRAGAVPRRGTQAR